jgi:acetylornithine/N-succinyldiaminopimelate aminotransferase
MNHFIETDKQYVANTYTRYPVEIVSGNGSLVYDANGKEYIDMGSGCGVNTFGVADPAWNKAVVDQLGKIQHTSNLYYNEPSAALAQLLCERTGMNKVYFANSGSEANECAIKIARKYGATHRGDDYYTIFTLTYGFHGTTLCTLSASGQEYLHDQFRPMTPGFFFIDKFYPSFDWLNGIADEFKCCAIIVETIQGECGVADVDPAFLKICTDVCKEKDLLLIYDETQTGCGRTGKLFSCEHYGYQPDIITVSQGLGGGLPISACIIGEKAKDALEAGDNGTTYGGNPVACAGAYSIFSRIDNELLNGVNAKHDRIVAALEGKSGINSISGRGLLIGIETEKPANEVVTTCMEHGVLCHTTKDKIRLMPALNIPDELLDRAVQIIADACAK